MHSRPLRKTGARQICSESWKICSTPRTEIRARTLHRFRQPSCASRSRLNAAPDAASIRYLTGQQSSTPSIETNLEGSASTELLRRQQKGRNAQLARNRFRFPMILENALSLLNVSLK